MIVIGLNRVFGKSKKSQTVAEEDCAIHMQCKFQQPIDFKIFKNEMVSKSLYFISEVVLSNKKIGKK